MKRLFTISALLLFSCASAQSPALVWAKNMGSNNINYYASASVAVDASGNVYATGPFNDNIFISKFDASGNFVWTIALGEPGYTQGSSIALDDAGNVYVTGQFGGTADFDPGPGTHNLTAVGWGNIFVCKLTAAGGFVWARQMGGADNNAANSIAVDAFGNVYTTGRFLQTADFDPGPGVYNLTKPNDGEWFTFISKLDASGNFVWAKQLGGGGGSVQEKAIKVDKSGNVYTTGKFFSTSDFDPGAGIYNLTASGYWDIFISKLDASGNFVWAKGMGWSGFDDGTAITIDDAGNVYTTGYFTNTVDFDPGPGTYNLTAHVSDDEDIFVSKLDASGNFVWAKNMGGPGYDEGYSIATDAAGNVYTTGYFSGPADFDPGSDIYNLTGGRDVFISKLDSSGNFVFAGNMGRSSSDGVPRGESLVLDAPGNMYITGTFVGIVNFSLPPGNDMYLNSETGNIFVVKLNQVPYCTTYYRDLDGDEFGNPGDSLSSCTKPPGYTTNNKDCNDNDKAVQAAVTYYRDFDSDGFGDPGHPISACSDTPPAGYITSNTDCNDSNKAVHVPITYYRDFDSDGFGDPGHPISACSATPPAGYVTNNTDCNDNNKAIHATVTYYQDSDSDGFGDPHHTICACSNTVPAGYVTNNKDCDDDDNTIHTLVTYYRDLDQDGFGDPNQPISASACTPPEGYVADSTDCNDNNKDIPSRVTYYLDFDRDGFGDPGHSIRVSACTPPSGYVTNNTDCNDNDNTIHARVTYYRDLDRDGYGDSYNSISVCSNVPPPGYVTTNYDCYDSGTVSHPEYVRVRMCHDGWTQCVNVKDIPEKLSLGWTLGLCPLQSCAADETLLCHNGKQVCVKTTDVPLLLAQADGKWSPGPLCSGTPISGNGSNKTGSAAPPAKGKSMPAAFKITSYPNPFEATTTISYELPMDCKVSIKVYDLVGRLVATLVDEYKKAGIYRVNFHAERLSSGTLYYRIVAKSKEGQFQQTNQMIKIK